MQESVPFWQLTLQRLMVFPVGQRVLFHWPDGRFTERIVDSGDNIDFIGECIREHGAPSPHSGIESLKGITVQLPTGVEGWNQPAQIWPDPRPPIQH